MKKEMLEMKKYTVVQEVLLDVEACGELEAMEKAAILLEEYLRKSREVGVTVMSR